MCDDQALNSS